MQMLSSRRWLQDFGLKEGLPGTPFYRGMQARKAIEAKLYAKIKPVIDNPGGFDGQRSLVLRLYQAFTEETEASGESITNECAPSSRHTPLGPTRCNSLAGVHSTHSTHSIQSMHWRAACTPCAAHAGHYAQDCFVARGQVARCTHAAAMHACSTATSRSTAALCREMARTLAQDAFFLMFAGTDTTSYSLMRCALYLDQYPEWFQKLKDEQDALRAEHGDTIDRKARPLTT